MSEDKGTLETPQEAVPEAVTETSPVNPREALEAAVIAKNEEVVPIESEETEAPSEPTKDEAAAEPKLEESSSQAERVKSEMLKRINKLTARSKTAEEEVAELRAENERLKREGVKPEIKPEVGEKREPTMEECRKALTKAFSDGDYEFAAQITEYMAEAKAKAQRVEAEKVYTERQTKQSEAQKKQLTDWSNLCRDYEPVTSEGKVDMKHPLNLSNQDGLLYKTALSLFKDKDLKSKYEGYDTITGFRIAVNDAWRGIHEQGLYQPVNAKVVEASKRQTKTLASPDADGADDAPVASTNEQLSDADKVREELKHRQSIRNGRSAPR